MEQLIIYTTHNTGIPTVLMIGKKFSVKIRPDGENLGVTIVNEECVGLRFRLPIEEEDYPCVEKLYLESRETGFDESFSQSIVADICEYLQTGRYWDDSKSAHRPFFSVEAYKTRWAKRLCNHIVFYKSGYYPMAEEVKPLMQESKKEQEGKQNIKQ